MRSDDPPKTYSFDLGRACAVLSERSSYDIDENRLAGADWIEEGIERLVTEFGNERGARLTGEPAHERLIEWIEDELESTDDIEVEALPYEIERWSLREASLSVPGAGEVPIAGYVPFTEPTGPEGITAPVVEAPRDEPIGTGDVDGKVVLREFPPGQIDISGSGKYRIYLHDPELASAEGSGPPESYPAARKVMETDLKEAAEAGAAAVLFVLEFPAEEIPLYLRPNFQGKDPSFRFTGGIWADAPGLFVGVDEGEALRERLSAGEEPEASLVVDADVEATETRTIVGRVPGDAGERVALATHTDGTNAIQENGVFGLLSLAKYFAGLPAEERLSRTIEFGFTTGHFYGRIGGRDYAQQLAEAGDVALFLGVEHLGTLGFRTVEREDGPGRVVEETGNKGGSSLVTTESPDLIAEVVRTVVNHDLPRTSVNRADQPGTRLLNEPATETPDAATHANNFGGEASMYYRNGLPTINYISGNFRLLTFDVGPELVDPDLYFDQTVALADLLHRVDDLSAEEIAEE